MTGGAGTERAVADLTADELRAELGRVEERLRQELASGGYRPVPGQTHRLVALRRREGQLVAELRARRALPADADPDAKPDEEPGSEPGSQPGSEPGSAGE